MYRDGQGDGRDDGEGHGLVPQGGRAGPCACAVQSGLMYAQGEGAKPDLATARKWFRRAADHGSVEAQFKLAELAAFEGKFEEAFAGSARLPIRTMPDAAFNVGRCTIWAAASRRTTPRRPSSTGAPPSSGDAAGAGRAEKRSRADARLRAPDRDLSGAPEGRKYGATTAGRRPDAAGGSVLRRHVRATATPGSTSCGDCGLGTCAMGFVWTIIHRFHRQA